MVKTKCLGRVFNILRMFNMLSIDVAIGALFSGYFVKIILPFQIHWSYWCILPLSVWIVYTADHLVDALRLKKKSHTKRHLFHLFLKLIPIE